MTAAAIYAGVRGSRLRSRLFGVGGFFVMMLVTVGRAEGSGFLIYDISGDALGRASAVSASTDEPAANFFNPAALAYMPGRAASVGGTWVHASSTFSALGNGGTTESKPGNFLLPAVFANAALGHRLVAGFGAYTIWGLGVNWPSGWPGAEQALSASIESINLNPNLALKLDERFSVAIGFNAVRAAVDFTNALPPIVGGEVRIAGNSWGYGANAALLYRLRPNQLHFAFTYRSRVRLAFDDGRADFDPRPELAGLLPDQGGRAVITLPDILTAGMMWRAAPSLQLTFDVNYVLWSTYDKLVLDFDTAPDIMMNRNYHNAFTFRGGVDWATGWNRLHLRGGLIYDQNPAPRTGVAPSLPDASRFDISFGLGYRGTRMRADLGYMLVYFLPSDARGGIESPEGTYRTTAHLLGLTIGVQFGN